MGHRSANAGGHPGLSLTARTLNRMLEREPWAREKLAAHAGRRFALEIGPSRFALAIGADGSFADDLSGADPPDLRLTLPMSAMPALLADPRRWQDLVTTDGDLRLAGSLAELATTVPWFVERAFAELLGPVAGQRVADAGRSALAAPEYVASRVIAGVARYARDEAELLAHPAELDGFARDVGGLSTRADAIEARIRQLEGTQSSGG